MDAACVAGNTIWLLNDTTGSADAYNALTRARESSKDISLGSGTWQGAVSDGTTLWFTQFANTTAVAYNASTGARDGAKDITLAGSRNEHRTGAAYDGTTLWFVNDTDDTAYAYTASTRGRDSSKDIKLGSADAWNSAVSDGTTIWFVRQTLSTRFPEPTTYVARAYNASTLARDSAKDIDLGAAPNGIQPDFAAHHGQTLWFGNRAYSQGLPPAVEGHTGTGDVPLRCFDTDSPRNRHVHAPATGGHKGAGNVPVRRIVHDSPRGHSARTA